MRSRVILFLFSMLCLVITGCTQNGQAAERVDYDETKKMVVDILKTDDGKKAIQDIMSEDGMKQQFIMDQKIVSDTIEKTITSDKGKQFWQKAFSDPKFAAAYANSMRDAHEQLIKDLTKDPQYRSMIMEIMRDPSVQREFDALFKSKEMREMSKTTLIETMDSPVVKDKIADILLKAAAAMPEKGGQGQQQGGG
ncbi:spore germination lipoprotein GerD [Peribacillus glennii]|uniref:Spore gernimation protein GerD n=1 Tax=Peribacillus glennii TaxID=2303991 RepID=A0A372L8Q7_9BACI|nr:spore germination lipoprotein GerD [Peribacillus glennii]RFU61448.1 spore gernimation protein GerD [Peribacillus glennii]